MSAAIRPIEDAETSTESDDEATVFDTIPTEFDRLKANLGKAKANWDTSPSQGTLSAFLEAAGEMIALQEFMLYMENHEQEVEEYPLKTIEDAIDNPPGSIDRTNLGAAMQAFLADFEYVLNSGTIAEAIDAYEPALRRHRETCTTCPWPFVVNPGAADDRDHNDQDVAIDGVSDDRNSTTASDDCNSDDEDIAQGEVSDASSSTDGSDDDSMWSDVASSEDVEEQEQWNE